MNLKKITVITKWEIDLNTNIPEENWFYIFKICFNTLKENYLIWTQYKILHRILGVKKYLHQLSIASDKQCSFCKRSDETLKHLFYDCSIVKNLWANVKTWILTKLNINLSFTPELIILGYIYPGTGKVPLNTILMISKSYIFWCSRKQITPNIFDLQKRIEKTYLDQRYIAQKNGKTNVFNGHWENLKCLLQGI